MKGNSRIALIKVFFMQITLPVYRVMVSESRNFGEADISENYTITSRFRDQFHNVVPQFFY